MTMAPDAAATASDPRSRRPVKRRALTPVSAQAAVVDALFARPEQEIRTDAAAGSRRAPPPPPEIVTNVQGSSAGAGSGEFHVYKAARRREHARVAAMVADVAAERAAADFEARKRQRAEEDDDRTRRNREKRDRARARKAKAKAGGGKGPAGKDGAKGGADGAPREGDEGEGSDDAMAGEDGPVKAPQPPPVADGPGLVIHDED